MDGGVVCEEDISWFTCAVGCDCSKWRGESKESAGLSKGPAIIGKSGAWEERSRWCRGLYDRIEDPSVGLW